MGDSGFGEVADGDGDNCSGEDGSKDIVGVASEEMLERFAGATIRLEGVEETRDGLRNLIGAATVADRTRDGSNVADTAADAEIVGVDKFAIDLDFFALDADVGDPVLTATVGAAGDVEFELMLEIGIAVFESFGKPAGEGFGFGESEFAEFGAGAGDGTTNESGTCDGKAGGVELGHNGGDMGIGDVDEEQILHGSGADVAVGVAFGEIGGEAKLRWSDAAANDGGADGEEAGLLLGNDAEMIAMDVRGGLLRFGGIESKPETSLDGSEERFGGPAVFEEEEFHAGTFAALAEDFAFAEDFGDGADDGDDLMRQDEGVEADGKVRLRGKAAGYADAETHFVTRDW